MSATTPPAETPTALSSSTYYYAHHTRAGCEAPAPHVGPKLIDPNTASASSLPSNELSQSKWNSSDYHWEERDLSQWFSTSLKTSILDKILHVAGGKGEITLQVVCEGSWRSSVASRGGPWCGDSIIIFFSKINQLNKTPTESVINFPQLFR